LLGAQLAVGAAAIFARFALTGAGPVAVSAWRLALAAVPFAAFALARNDRVRPGAGREAALALAGVALAVHFAAWIASLLYAPVGISTLLVCTSPLWTGAFDAARSRRMPRASYVLGVALAVAGIAGIVMQRVAPAPEPGHFALGATLALTGGLALAVYFMLVSAYGNAPARGPALTTGAIVARTYAWAALTLLAASAVLRQPPPSAGDWRAWAGIVAMAVVSQGIGHTGMNAALRDFRPNVVALSTLLEPPIAALFAIAIFHETLSGQIVAGAVAVLAGVALALWDESRSAA
jgi:drug/metabolite transporter (DMT)-like permease